MYRSFHIPTAVEELAAMWVVQTEENRHQNENTMTNGAKMRPPCCPPEQTILPNAS